MVQVFSAISESSVGLYPPVKVNNPEKWTLTSSRLPDMYRIEKPLRWLLILAAAAVSIFAISATLSR
jgi:hypothetical protein